MGACPVHGVYHSEEEQMICLTTQLCKYMTLGLAARRWRAAIQANSKKWSKAGTQRVLKAGRDIYAALDNIDNPEGKL